MSNESGGGFGIGALGGLVGGFFGGIVASLASAGGAVASTRHEGGTILGDTGGTGAAGRAGFLGSAGATGPTGRQGPEMGFTGPTGDSGATGAVNPVSALGSTGTTGPVGPTGAPGPKGSATGVPPAYGLVYYIPPPYFYINWGTDYPPHDALQFSGFGPRKNTYIVAARTGISGNTAIAISPGHAGVYKVIFRAPAYMPDGGANVASSAGMWGLYRNSQEQFGSPIANSFVPSDGIRSLTAQLFDNDYLQLLYVGSDGSTEWVPTVMPDYPQYGTQNGAVMFAFIFLQKIG